MTAVRTLAVVPADHPCLAGHFPGEPIVPAVVVLEHVFEALRAALPAPARVVRLSSAKFVSPLRPGVEFAVELEVGADGRSARFRCSAAGRELASGRLACG